MHTMTPFIGGPFDPDRPIPETVTHIHVQCHYHNGKEGCADQPGIIQRGIYQRDEFGLFVWQTGATLAMETADGLRDTGLDGFATKQEEETP
jgi:hypothetical protein